MRRAALLCLLVFAMAASVSAKDLCGCSTPPASQPGSATFESDRKAFLVCYLTASAAALSGKDVPCVEGMRTAIANDARTLQSVSDALKPVVDSATGDTKTALQANLETVNRALQNEKQYVGMATPPPPEATVSCDCPDGVQLIDLQRDLADSNPSDDLDFVGHRITLASCIKELRDPAKLKCSDKVKTLEGMLTSDVKTLIAARDDTAKQLANTDAGNEDQLEARLEHIKHALNELRPFVVIADSGVTVRRTLFDDAHDKEIGNPQFEAKCASPFAYLDVASEDTDNLLKCIDVVRERCREAKGKDNIRTCERNLSRLEEKLREFAGGQFQKEEQLKSINNPTPDQKAQLDKIDKTLEAIRKTDIVPDEGDLPEYGDYKQWWSKFAMGYEYVNLNDAFTTGNPRIGAAIGLGLPRQSVPDSSQHNWHPVSYGLFTTFLVGLTNTAEQTKTSFPAGVGVAGAVVAADTNGTADKPTPKNRIGFEEQVFWPWWRSDLNPEDRRLRTWAGPIFSIGGRKLDETDEPFLTPRVYGGLRLARSPEMFADFLYGRSGGWSRRTEIRGQYPLPHRFGNGARIVLGAMGNFGVNQRRRGRTCPAIDDVANSICVSHPAEPDVISFYLSYDIQWGDLLKYFTK